MHNSLLALAYQNQIKELLLEDDLDRNALYLNRLPQHPVKCVLKIKDDLILSGVPFFISVFESIYPQKIDWGKLIEQEGRNFSKSEKAEFSFVMPFSVALTGERLALNLIARSSAISTQTRKFVDLCQNSNIALLDTRKTTPGLRWLEKYAVNLGGGNNHRFSQTDIWMIKDNHKSQLGGLKGAWSFFKELKDFYRPVIVEIHSLDELNEATKLGVRHIMLDNFSPEKIKEAVRLKVPGMTFEVSGGISLENVKNYLIEGVDALSIGSLTNGAKPVDLSLKME